MPTPKIVFIDWYKTLSHSTFWEQWSNPNHPFHAFAATLNRCLFYEQKNLLCTWMKGRQQAEEIAERISKEISLDQTIVFRELVYSCQNMTLAHQCLLELIQHIRQQQIRVVIATDNMDTFRRFTIPALRLDQWFDDFLISCEVKCLKDETKNNIPIFFDSYLNQHGYTYSQAVLLDDCAVENGPLAQLGMNVIRTADTSALITSLSSFILSP